MLRVVLVRAREGCVVGAQAESHLSEGTLHPAAELEISPADPADSVRTMYKGGTMGIRKAIVISGVCIAERSL